MLYIKSKVILYGQWGGGSITSWFCLAKCNAICKTITHGRKWWEKYAIWYVY